MSRFRGVRPERRPERRVTSPDRHPLCGPNSSSIIRSVPSMDELTVPSSDSTPPVEGTAGERRPRTNRLDKHTRSQTQGRWGRTTRLFRGLLRWGLWPLLKWGLIVGLPFGALLRGSTYAYQQQWPLPLALGAGLAAAFLILLLYVTWVHARVCGAKAAYRRRALRIKALLVLVGLGVFQGYVLLAPDPAHLGPDDRQAEYAELHPLLRMSVATFLFADDSLLITDLSRHPRDYEAMGLPVNPQSLHYRQADGYVHALDLRTNGHSAVRNLLMQGYFAALGFRTLRHVGTADHLHVALPVPKGERVRSP
jgi:hypothetical protein